MSQEIFGLLVRIEATTAGLRAELNRAKSEVDGAAGAFDKGAKKAETAVVRMHQAAERSARLSTAQLQTLKYTASDIVASLGSGMSPMMILLQQGPQVLQSFNLSMSRAALGVTGVAAAALAAVAAMESYRSSVRAVDLAHRAMGGHLGVTLGDLEQLAQQAADTGDISVRAAREQIEVYTRTGKIGTEVMSGLIAVSKDFATAVGIDAAEATNRLAKLFSDPKAAAEALTKEMNLLGDADREHITALVEAGRTQEANLFILGKVQDRVKGMRGEIGLLAGAWDSVTKAASAVWNATGTEIAGAVFGSEETRAPGQPTRQEARLRERISELEEVIRLEAISYPEQLDSVKRKRDEELAAMRAQLEVETRLRQETDARVEAAARLAAEQARLKAESVKVDDYVRQAGGGVQAEEITRLENQLKVLDANRNNPEVGSVTRAGEAMARERLQNRLQGLLAADAQGVDLETYRQNQMSSVLRQSRGMKPEEAQRFLAQSQAEIAQIGTMTTALEREAAIRQSVTQVEVGQFQARQQMTDGLRLQVDAQNRLADAAGKGEAAQRAANAENEIAAARYRSVAEGAAQQAAAVELEAAARRQIAGEQNAQLDDQVIRQQRLNGVMLSGPEAVQDLTIREQARTLALREAVEGTDAYTEALDRYLVKLRTLSDAEKTGGLQVLVDQGGRNLQQARDRQGMVGMSDREQARAEARMQATEALRQAGIVTTQGLSAEQQRLVDLVYAHADAQAEVAQATRESEAVYAEFGSFVDQSFDRIGSSITQIMLEGGDAIESLGNLGRAVISELTQEFIKFAMINPLKNAILGTALPTLAGAMAGGAAAHGGANLAGGGGTYGGFQNGPQFRAVGGPVTAGMPYVVGEAGRELFVPEVNGRILPSVPAVAAAGVQPVQQAGDTIHVNLHVGVGVAQTVRAEMQNLLPGITQNVKAAVADARQRGGGYSRAMGR